MARPPDKDRHLAHYLGERLEAGASVVPEADAQDPFLRTLAALKEQSPAERPAPAATARMWEAIDDELDAQAAQRPGLHLVQGLLRPLSTSAWARYATAAVVLIAVALGGLLYLRSDADAPVLVAEAHDAVTTYFTPDSSVVTLRPGTRLYSLVEDADVMRYRLAGEAYFEVVPNPDRSFVVEAREAEVAVLGTTFDVRAWGTETSVYLVEGRVRMTYEPTGETIILAPGQRGVVTGGSVLLPPTPATADEDLDWMRGELLFAERPLSSLLEELGQHYSLSLQVPDTLLAETFTGRILLNNQMQTLQDLGVVMGGRFEPSDDTTFTFVID